MRVYMKTNQIMNYGDQSPGNNKQVDHAADSSPLKCRHS